MNTGEVMDDPQQEAVVPVMGMGRRDGLSKEDVPDGLITWEEHWEAWFAFHESYPRGESAEEYANHGGFSFGDLTQWLGRAPRTWVPRDMRTYKQFWEEMYNPSEEPVVEEEPALDNDPFSHLWYGDGVSICKSEEDVPTTPFNFDVVEGEACPLCLDKVLRWLRDWNNVED